MTTKTVKVTFAELVDRYESAVAANEPVVRFGETAMSVVKLYIFLTEPGGRYEPTKPAVMT